jgi:hypothetical protein
MRVALPILLILPLSLLAQQPSADTKELLNRQAGVEMTFRNPRPPLAKLTFGLVGTAELSGRKLVRYSVAANGLAKGGPYILMSWDIGTKAPVISIQEVKVDNKGTIRCGDDAKDCPGAGPGAALVVGLSGMIGQPRRFVLTGSDKKPVAMGEAVPFPASGSDQNCTIEAVLMLPNGAATLVIGRGFQPNEAVRFASSSYDESIDSAKIADETGDVVTVVLPFVNGHDEGKTTVSMIGSRCRPSTAFSWGSYREELVDQAFNK